jgi:hypothetical protein
MFDIKFNTTIDKDINVYCGTMIVSVNALEMYVDEKWGPYLQYHSKDSRDPNSTPIPLNYIPTITTITNARVEYRILSRTHITSTGDSLGEGNHLVGLEMSIYSLPHGLYPIEFADEFGYSPTRRGPIPYDDAVYSNTKMLQNDAALLIPDVFTSIKSFYCTDTIDPYTQTRTTPARIIKSVPERFIRVKSNQQDFEIFKYKNVDFNTTFSSSSSITKLINPESTIMNPIILVDHDLSVQSDIPEVTEAQIRAWVLENGAFGQIMLGDANGSDGGDNVSASSNSLDDIYDTQSTAGFNPLLPNLHDLFSTPASYASPFFTQVDWSGRYDRFLYLSNRFDITVPTDANVNEFSDNQGTDGDSVNDVVEAETIMEGQSPQTKCYIYVSTLNQDSLLHIRLRGVDSVFTIPMGSIQIYDQILPAVGGVTNLKDSIENRTFRITNPSSRVDTIFHHFQAILPTNHLLRNRIVMNITLSHGVAYNSTDVSYKPPDFTELFRFVAFGETNPPLMTSFNQIQPSDNPRMHNITPDIPLTLHSSTLVDWKILTVLGKNATYIVSMGITDKTADFILRIGVNYNIYNDKNKFWYPFFLKLTADHFGSKLLKYDTIPVYGYIGAWDSTSFSAEFQYLSYAQSFVQYKVPTVYDSNTLTLTSSYHFQVLYMRVKNLIISMTPSDTLPLIQDNRFICIATVWDTPNLFNFLPNNFPNGPLFSAELTFFLGNVNAQDMWLSSWNVQLEHRNTVKLDCTMVFSDRNPILRETVTTFKFLPYQLLTNRPVASKSPNSFSVSSNNMNNYEFTQHFGVVKENDISENNDKFQPQQVTNTRQSDINNFPYHSKDQISFTNGENFAYWDLSGLYGPCFSKFILSHPILIANPLSTYQITFQITNFYRYSGDVLKFLKENSGQSGQNGQNGQNSDIYPNDVIEFVLTRVKQVLKSLIIQPLDPNDPLSLSHPHINSNIFQKFDFNWDDTILTLFGLKNEHNISNLKQSTNQNQNINGSPGEIDLYNNGNGLDSASAIGDDIVNIKLVWTKLLLTPELTIPPTQSVSGQYPFSLPHLESIFSRLETNFYQNDQNFLIPKKSSSQNPPENPILLRKIQVGHSPEIYYARCLGVSKLGHGPCLKRPIGAKCTAVDQCCAPIGGIGGVGGGGGVGSGVGGGVSGGVGITNTESQCSCYKGKCMPLEIAKDIFRAEYYSHIQGNGQSVYRVDPF